MSHRRAVLGVFSAVAFAVSGWGVAQAAVARSQATIVSVRLVEWTVVPSRMSAPAGKITFVVRNTGSMKHEFVVLRTRFPASKQPMQAGGKQASELGNVGELEEFRPGQTHRLTLTLKRGHYVLLCNLPGHYKLGQRVDFVVR